MMKRTMNPEHAARAAEMVAAMTLEQKIGQISCYFARTLAEVENIADAFPHGVGHVSCLEVRTARTPAEVVDWQRAVQQIVMERSGHGIPATFHMEGVCGAFLPGATSYPNGMARGASWDTEVERRIGEAVGRQERAFAITQTLAPVLDVARDPRMGRIGEAYGEDATLVAALGTAFALGLQGTDEDGRTTDAVAKHFVGSHDVEGGIHGALVDISERTLREVHAKPFQAAITEAGLRGIMPSYNVVGSEPASASTRLLTTLLRDEMGFDGLCVSDYSAIANLNTVQRVAESPEAAGLLALAAGLDVEFPNPFAFTARLQDLFADGQADIALLDRAVRRVLESKMRMGLFESPFAATGSELDQRYVRAADVELSLESARNSIVLLKNDGSLPLRPQVRRLAVIGPHAASARYFFGGYTHYSMAEALLAVNSSMAGVEDTGVVREISDTIPGTSVERSDGPQYEELLTTLTPGVPTLLDELRSRLVGTEVLWAPGYPIAGLDESGHEDALALAATADVVIVTLGGKHGMASISTTGEGIDATNINLPPSQEAFLRRLAALEVPVKIGVHLDGRPLSSEAADDCLGGILEAWSPAEHGAKAIVDTLVGDNNPSGRLPVTVARHAGQVPIHYSHAHGSSWHQGASIGFPDYVDMPHTPRYHFGHGLSYTTFDYGELRLDRDRMPADETVTATVTVTNSGERAGVEVVQMYAADRYASVARPVLELVGFARVRLEAGETAEVRFGLSPRQLAFLDQQMRWRVEAGDVDLYCGSSSVDLPATAVLTITTDEVIDPAHRPFWAPSTVLPMAKQRAS